MHQFLQILINSNILQPNFQNIRRGKLEIDTSLTCDQALTYQNFTISTPCCHQLLHQGVESRFNEGKYRFQGENMREIKLESLKNGGGNGYGGSAQKEQGKKMSFLVHLINLSLFIFSFLISIGLNFNEVIILSCLGHKYI